MRVINRARREVRHGGTEMITTQQPQIAILLPCYNEAASIGQTIADFRAALPQAAIYVYDNNSTDNTAEVARAAGAIVRTERMQGKGNVVRRMFADVDADIYVMADGDATYEAAAAPKLIALLQDDQLDMVVGARKSEVEAAYRRGHRLGNALLTGMLAWLFGRSFTDILSGYRVFSRRFVKSFPVLSEGFEIETEISVHALELRMPVAECVTAYAARPEGSESKLNTYRDGWRILRMILTLFRIEKPLAFFGLMGGRLFGVSLGLSPVPTDQWGGLPLTLMLSSLSIALAFPLAVLVALGRRSDLPAIKTICVTYVELVRGVPLISVLFMASFMFPLLMPAGTTPDVLLRVLVGITLFSAAYTAEIVRGGLQAIPRGQYEAAASLGLGYWKTQRIIILPQALAHVVPGIMNNFIAIFKDTSLVTIVSLYELSGALGLALNGDPLWRPFKIEGYLFITLIYFAFCFAMSRYSLWVEHRLQRSQAR